MHNTAGRWLAEQRMAFTGDSPESTGARSTESQQDPGNSQISYATSGQMQFPMAYFLTEETLTHLFTYRAQLPRFRA